MTTEEGNHGESTQGRGSVEAANQGEGIMLFGVRVSTEGSFRKSASMNNLSQYEQVTSRANQQNPGAGEAGYDSDDVVHQSGRGRERKRGMPWTEEEHRLFLIGLQKVGKGDWRGISRNFVRTRTPTQVASHAQKYFLRRTNQNRRRRRSSLFDITTEDPFVGPLTSIDESQEKHEITMSTPPPRQPKTCSLYLAPRTTTSEKGETRRPEKPTRPIVPIPPPTSQMSSLDLNSANSTDATLDPSPSSSFQAMSNGDSIITVS